MTHHAFLLVLFCLGVLSAIAAATTQVAMLRGIRRERGNETADADELRVLQILYIIHRDLFPQSRLRKINGISLILLAIATVAVIAVSKFPW